MADSLVVHGWQCLGNAPFVWQLVSAMASTRFFKSTSGFTVKSTAHTHHRLPWCWSKCAWGFKHFKIYTSSVWSRCSFQNSPFAIQSLALSWTDARRKHDNIINDVDFADKLPQHVKFKLWCKVTRRAEDREFPTGRMQQVRDRLQGAVACRIDIPFIPGVDFKVAFEKLFRDIFADSLVRGAELLVECRAKEGSTVKACLDTSKVRQTTITSSGFPCSCSFMKRLGCKSVGVDGHSISYMDSTDMARTFPANLNEESMVLWRPKCLLQDGQEGGAASEG